MVARVMPDTCAWIDFFRGTLTSQAELVEDALSQGTIVTCGVVLYELLQGIKNKTEAEHVMSAFQGMPHLEMTAATWIKAAQLSARLRSNGQTLPMSDIIIATLALEHTCTLVSIDHHFAAIEGLSLRS